MATIPDHVQPGDIIKSADFNLIIDALKDHESRIAQLEGAGAVATNNNVAITGLAPAGGLQVGGQVTIFGRNFGFSTGAQSVFFNNSRATIFNPNSTDSKLIVDKIPDVPGIQASGTQVTLTVANFASSDSRQVTLTPAPLQQGGNVTVSFQSVTPTTVVQGSTPVFTYLLESRAELQANMTIAPVISVAGLNLQVLDVTGAALPNNQILINPGEQKQISVKTDPIPAGVNSFTITVNASSSGMQGSTDKQSISIGSPIDQPDGEVPTLTPNRSVPPTALNKSTNTITVAAGTTATVQLLAEFSGADPRTYNLLLSVLPPATGWTATLSQSAAFQTPSSYQITGPITELPAFDVTPQAQATSPAFLQFTLQRAGSPLKKSLQCTLQLG
jgi:hypothetical protein